MTARVGVAKGREDPRLWGQGRPASDCSDSIDSHSWRVKKTTNDTGSARLEAAESMGRTDTRNDPHLRLRKETARMTAVEQANSSYLKKQVAQGEEERVDAILRQELVQAKAQCEALRREMREMEVQHRAALSKQLDEARKKARAELESMGEELRGVKSERNKLEWEADQLRIQLTDAQREAKEAYSDLAAARERDERELEYRLREIRGEKGDLEHERRVAASTRAELQQLRTELATTRGKLSSLESREQKLAAEVAEFRRLFSSVDQLKGVGMKEMEIELLELRKQVRETRTGPLAEAQERNKKLEATVCCLQDVIRDLKDDRSRYMAKADIDQRERVESLECDLRKAREEARKAREMLEAWKEDMEQMAKATGEALPSGLKEEFEFFVAQAAQTGRKYFGVM